MTVPNLEGVQIRIALPGATMEEWVKGVAAVYGNRSQVNAIERAGAAAWRKVARRNAPRRRGELRKSIGTFRSRQGGMGIKVNRKGDGNYGPDGTGVRYGTVVHQGREESAPFAGQPFFYGPTDPESAIRQAVQAKLGEHLRTVSDRAAALLGRLGPAAQEEIEAKIAKGSARFGGGSGSGPFGQRAQAETRAFLATLADSYEIDDDREIPARGSAF